MASDLSKYLGNKIARWLAGNAMPTEPSDLYVALFDGDPRSGGTEVTTTVAAARLPISFAALAENDTDNVLTSDADVDFGAALAAADIDWVAIFDASTSGNRVAQKAVPPVSVVETQEIIIPAGDLSFTIGA